MPPWRLVSDTAPPGRRGEALEVALGNQRGLDRRSGLGGLTADLLSFEAPFLIFCGLALALLFAALAAYREEPRPASAMPALPAIHPRDAVGTRRLGGGDHPRRLPLAGLVELVAPLDLDAASRLSSSAIGLLFAASIAVDAAVSPFGGRWGDRRGRRDRDRGTRGDEVSMVALAVLPGVGGTAVALVSTAPASAS